MKYETPKLTVDGVILKNNRLLLIKRRNLPFKGKWAFPGGFVEYGEKTEDAVIREVLEETGLETKINDLMGVYSDPTRDPRGHTVSVVYLLDVCGGFLSGADDASEAKFFDLDQLPELAFDHDIIVKDVLRRFE
jgi:8-oxo-dGTP diphosphatase